MFVRTLVSFPYVRCAGDQQKINTGILNLGMNELAGAIPTTIGELVNLDTVFLETNFLGTDRADDGSVVNLIPDSLPSQIGLLTNLQILNVKNNYLSTSGDLNFDYFISMTNLSKLPSRREVSVTKTIPSDNVFCIAATLDLKINEFAGQIQSQIGQLPSTLTLLDLSANMFTGTLPTEIGNLVALTDLRIAKSDTSADPDGRCPSGCLTGALPTELGRLVNLETLWLFQNSFTGMLPSELGNMEKLTECLLYSNSIEGEIPKAFSDLKNLGAFPIYGFLGCVTID
jgi:Leucine-rich repeat (LRR) protein